MKTSQTTRFVIAGIALVMGCAFVLSSIFTGEAPAEGPPPTSYESCIRLPLTLTNEQLRTAKCLNGSGEVVVFGETSYDPDKLRAVQGG